MHWNSAASSHTPHNVAKARLRAKPPRVPPGASNALRCPVIAPRLPRALARPVGIPPRTSRWNICIHMPRTAFGLVLLATACSALRVSPAAAHGTCSRRAALGGIGLALLPQLPLVAAAAVDEKVSAQQALPACTLGSFRPCMTDLSRSFALAALPACTLGSFSPAVHGCRTAEPASRLAVAELAR